MYFVNWGGVFFLTDSIYITYEPPEHKGEQDTSYVYDWPYERRASFLERENQRKNIECKLCWV